MNVKDIYSALSLFSNKLLQRALFMDFKLAFDIDIQYFRPDYLEICPISQVPSILGLSQLNKKTLSIISIKM